MSSLYQRICEITGTSRHIEIAKILGVSPALITEIKKGRSGLSGKKAKKIAEKNNISLEYILFGIKNTEGKKYATLMPGEEKDFSPEAIKKIRDNIPSQAEQRDYAIELLKNISEENKILINKNQELEKKINKVETQNLASNVETCHGKSLQKKNLDSMLNHKARNFKSMGQFIAKVREYLNIDPKHIEITSMQNPDALYHITTEELSQIEKGNPIKEKLSEQMKTIADILGFEPALLLYQAGIQDYNPLSFEDNLPPEEYLKKYIRYKTSRPVNKEELKLIDEIILKALQLRKNGD